VCIAAAFPDCSFPVFAVSLFDLQQRIRANLAEITAAPGAEKEEKERGKARRENRSRNRIRLVYTQACSLF